MNRLYQKFCAGLLLTLLLAAILPAQAEPLRLTSGVGMPYFQPDKKGFLDLLIPEIFRRIGVAAQDHLCHPSQKCSLA